jgi:hypothetical protein
MVGRFRVSVGTVALALPALFTACISTTSEDGSRGDGTSGASWTGGDNSTSGASGTVGTGGAGGTVGTGGAGGYGNVAGTTYVDACFNPSACCIGGDVVIVGPGCPPSDPMRCDLGCDPLACVMDISRAALLCRENQYCGHHFDCIVMEAAAGTMLACDPNHHCIRTTPPPTERPSDLGASCMLPDEETFFTDPNAVETFLTRAPECMTGICVLDEADTLGMPQRCTYRCTPGVTDCGMGYECRELPVRGEMGDPPAVAVCVNTGAI